MSTIYSNASLPGQYLNLVQEQASSRVGNGRVGLADRIGGFHSEAGLNALLQIHLAILAGLSRLRTFGQLQKQDPLTPKFQICLVSPSFGYRHD
ncbi:MAG: hypothetical protein C0407_10860 [Desulfobacca sp.]|nr:hypothetical protein [Desulfobacca sp.]